MRILLPDETHAGHWDRTISSIVDFPFQAVFSDLSLDFVSEVSKTILGANELRNYPELAALAHWLRKKHLLELKERYLITPRGTFRKPRGVIFHITPANVDSMFVYSWFISLLTGNKNIIRVTNNISEQIDFLIGRINRVIGKKKFNPLKQTNIVLTYEHDDQITKQLSESCDVRVLWGGDETVKKIRQTPLSPHAKDVAFADRYSFAVLQSDAIVELDGKELLQFALDFFNDTYWFNQNACSSPRTLIWVGDDKTIAAAKSRFWSTLTNVIEKKHVRSESSEGLLRLTTAYAYAATNKLGSLEPRYTGHPYRAQLKTLDSTTRSLHCGYGFFPEFSVESLDNLLTLLESKDQTISIFGFDQSEINYFIENTNKRCFDRIVPVGKALEFSPIWDGYNLFDEFTYLVNSKMGP